MSFADFARGDGRGGDKAPLLGGDDGGPSRGGGGGFGRDAQAAASGIFQLTTQVSGFKRQVDALGTAKDTRESRARLHKSREQCGALAKETTAGLKRLADTLPAGDSRAKAQHTKLLKDFQAVLREFQKAQRLCAEKEATFLPNAPAASSSASGSRAGMEVPMDSYQRGQDLEQQALLQQQEMKRMEVQQLEGELEYNNAIIEEREAGIAEIQAQIGEVNEIFQDLAVLVNEQGTMIDDIEANIVRTSARTKEAQRELTRADKSQKSARTKMFCLMIIFAVVLIIILIAILA